MIYVVAVLLFLILAILFYRFFIKKQPEEDDKNYKVKDSDKDTLQITEKYMFQIELKILSVLNQSLSAEYIALPKVCLGSLLAPKGSKVVYNILADKVVDFVIFEKSTMKPVLVVDIYDNTFNDEALSEQDPNLTKILTDLKLPIVAFLVKGNVNMEEFKNLINSKLPQKEKKDEEKQK